MTETHESMNLKIKILNLSDENQEALRLYNEFKKLREQMGKPIKEHANREEIIKDLRGDGFSPLGKGIEPRKTPKTRRITA